MTNGHNPTPAAAMTRNMSDLASDVAGLAELQARLVAIDAKECVRRLIAPLVLIGIGAVLLLGSIPVLLLGVAYLLTLTGLGLTASLFISFLIGAVLGSILVLAAWFLLRNSLTTFERSRKELAQNLRWLKDALKQTGRPGESPEPH